MMKVIPFSKKSKALKSAKADFEKGNIEGALKAFRALGYEQGIIEVGNHYQSSNKFRQAVRLFKEVGFDDGIRQIGELLLERGRFNEMEKTLQNLSTPAPPEMYMKAGLLLREKGDLQGAEKAFQISNNSESLMNIAQAYLDKNDLSNAVRLFRKLDAPEETRRVALNYMEKGDRARARKLFEELGDDEGLRLLQTSEEQDGQSV